VGAHPGGPGGLTPARGRRAHDDGQGPQELGREGERLAAVHLAARGYRVVARGFRTRRGELDLVCRRGNRLLVVEVKTRRSDRWGPPSDAVGAVKWRRLRGAAAEYRAWSGWRGDIGFAVVAITMTDGGPQIEVLENAA
jgi:putative endonuclease